LPHHFSEPCNIGIVLGASNLTDIDVDSPQALHFLDWLPPTSAIWGRAGNPSSHHLYLGARPSKKFSTKSLGMIVEIRSNGCQSLVPPSVHPDGEPYIWECEGEPGTDEGLEFAVTKFATCTA